VKGDEVAAKRLETRLTVPVYINGEGPFRFLVDTGADRSVVTSALAARLSLPASRPVRLVGAVETAVVPTVSVARLRVGGSEVANLQTPALSERDMGADGLIGIDALAEQRLMLDFQRGTVTIQDARRRVLPLPGEIVVTARRLNGQLIITQASVGGRGVMAVIDSGAMLSVGNTALMRRVFSMRQPPLVQMVELTGVTGAKRSVPVAIVPELRVGNLIVTNVPVAFADLPPFARFGLADEPALLLGTDVLEVFARVSLDFRKRTSSISATSYANQDGRSAPMTPICPERGTTQSQAGTEDPRTVREWCFATPREPDARSLAHRRSKSPVDLGALATMRRRGFGSSENAD
jgi:predicted aspartyl protease